MKRGLLWAFVALVGVVPAFSQWTARTITNADLEGYRQERLRAERDYAQNYDKMGFPSPQELEMQLEKSRAEREELAARLASERLQRYQIEADVARAAQPSQESIIILSDGNGSGNNGWSAGGYYPYGPYGYPGRFGRSSRYGNFTYTWPGRLGNGVPFFDSLSPRTSRPRYPSVGPIRRRWR